jgi:hypothetical protein
MQRNVIEGSALFERARSGQGQHVGTGRLEAEALLGQLGG